MDARVKHNLGILAGIAILLLDAYWTYIAWSNPVPQMLGILIFVAAIVWLWADM